MLKGLVHMNDSAQPRLTPLHDAHVALGAKMAPFGGWDMPLWYAAGAVKEHLAAVTGAGMFDTSHMDVVMLRGAWRGLLDAAFTRDLEGWRENRILYGAFLDARGHCLDDATVYPLDDERCGIVVNAGMGGVIAEHLRALPAASAGAGVSVELPEPRVGKVDIQGPEAARILARLIDGAGELFVSFPYFSFKGDFDFARSGVKLADGTPVLLSRSGYTGELGFEIYLPWDRVVTVWEQLLAAGADKGILPCGLAARDSLRAGAVLPLSHQDIGDWLFINHPWGFTLPVGGDGKFSKDFVGAGALAAGAASAPHTLPFVGNGPQRVDSHAGKVLLDGEEIGGILTIVSDMAIGRVDGVVYSLASPDKPAGWQPRGLACGFVKVARKLAPGTEVILKDTRREIPVRIVEDIRPARTARKKIIL